MLHPIYSMYFWELRGLSPNFHIHVSVSVLYIPRIGPLIILQQNIGRSIVGIYKTSQTHKLWKLGLPPRSSFSGNMCFEFSVLCLCSVLSIISYFIYVPYLCCKFFLHSSDIDYNLPIVFYYILIFC
jgi:hypothetical protein